MRTELQPPQAEPRGATRLIAAAQVWTPLADEGGVELADVMACDPALGDGLPAVGQTLLGGEGLAGQAWARQVPLLVGLPDDDESAEASTLKAHGVTTAIAMPTFDHQRVGSVLVLYLRGGQDVRTAVEFWAGRPGHHELCTIAAAYPGLERFGGVSKYVHFPMGSGLPGKVWQAARAMVIDQIAEAPDFLRSTGAGSEGLSRGFGLPLIRGLELCSVLVTLDSDAACFAAGYEVWEQRQRAGIAVMGPAQALGPEAKHYVQAGRGVTYQPGEALVGKAWASRRPQMTDALAEADPRRKGAAESDALRFGLAIPVLVADEVRSVALLVW